MSTYYKIKRDSKEGIELTNLFAVSNEARKQAFQLAEKYGFEGFCRGYWTYTGGCSAFAYPKNIDPKLWKIKEQKFYKPRLNTKEGKAIAKEMASIPRVEQNDVNKVFGLNIFAGLGFIINNKEWFGFSFSDSEDHNPIIPSHAIEITRSEYNNLAKENK